jgi:hypothetical protein
METYAGALGRGLWAPREGRWHRELIVDPLTSTPDLLHCQNPAPWVIYPNHTSQAGVEGTAKFGHILHVATAKALLQAFLLLLRRRFITGAYVRSMTEHRGITSGSAQH